MVLATAGAAVHMTARMRSGNVTGSGSCSMASMTSWAWPNNEADSSRVDPSSQPEVTWAPKAYRNRRAEFMWGGASLNVTSIGALGPERAARRHAVEQGGDVHRAVAL